MEWYYGADGQVDGPHPGEDIESLVLTGRITRDTPVWREGLDSWVPIASQPEFTKLFRATPPPLPPVPRPAPSVDVARLEADLLELSPAVAPAPVTDPDEPWSVEPPRQKGELIFGGGPKINPELAGPWTRYFARCIDLSLIGSAIATAINLVVPYVSTPLTIQWYLLDARVAFILLLPFAHAVNALIITVFGNSIGKAIFGIRALPVGRDRFTFGESLQREFRVWTQGMALNIPIVNLFTLYPAFQQVTKSQPTNYDLGIANVKSFSKSGFRRAIGIILALALLVGISALNTVERGEQARVQAQISTPLRWTNPDTGVIVNIPAGWIYQKVEDANGAPLHGFTNLQTGMVALMAHETFPDLDLSQYSEGLKAALAVNTPLGDWTPAGAGILKASGSNIAKKWPTTIYVTSVGDTYWRIVYLDETNLVPREIGAADMTAALFGTVR